MIDKLAVIQPVATTTRDLSKGFNPNPQLCRGEDPQAYEALRLRYVDQFRPRGFIEFNLLNDAVHSHWWLNRMLSLKTRAMSTETMFHLLPELERSEKHCRRMHKRAMKHLREFTDRRKAA